MAEEKMVDLIHESIPNTTGQVEEERPYVFRKLKSTDLFLMIKLIKKIGLDNIGKAINAEALNTVLTGKEGKTDDDFYEVGMAVIDMVQVIIERMEYCQNEVYDLLEATSNLSRQELEDLDIDIFIEMITAFVRKDEFKQLFTRAASLLQKGN